MSGLKGKTIVLTGAGQGLGRAAAIAFSEAGARVALLGRTLSKLEQTAEKMPGESLFVSVSLDDPQSVREAFAQIKEHYLRSQHDANLYSSFVWPK